MGVYPIIENELAAMVGKRITQLRHEKGWTQQELADMIGVSRSGIAGWEKGSRLPDVDSWFNMALVFEVSTDYICGTSTQRIYKGSSISDKLDIEKLNDLGRHMLFEFYHMLLGNNAFCKTPSQMEKERGLIK